MPSPRPDKKAAAAEAWAGIRAFVESNERSGHLRERLGLGVGSGRVKVLILLKDGPLSLSDLASAHRVTAPYATIIVDQLEGLGFVQRTLDPIDRRRKIVALTSAGRDAVATAEAVIATPPAALDALSLDELDQLRGLLVRINAAGE